MTKYILHGGNTREINSDNDGFFREMTQGSKGRTLVLLNYFSKISNEVEKFAGQDKGRFLENSENKDLEFEIAQTDKLAEQLARAYVMYMRGGETGRLLEKLSQTPNLQKHFSGKVVAGSSAGVYALAKCYWSKDLGRLGDGLGILNLKAFCHYKREDEASVEQLFHYKEKLPLLVLPDYKWQVVFE